MNLLNALCNQIEEIKKYIGSKMKVRRLMYFHEIFNNIK